MNPGSPDDLSVCLPLSYGYRREDAGSCIDTGNGALVLRIVVKEALLAAMLSLQPPPLIVIW